MSKVKVVFRGRVTEMTNEVGDLKLPDSINIQKLITADKNPMFVTVEVARPTKSKNKNIYTEKVLEILRDKINTEKPPAYSGHLPEEQRPYVKPETVTQWLWSEIKEIGGKKVLLAKGYVYKTAKALREELRVAEATGRSVPVSLNGMAEKKYNKKLDGYEIVDIDLESIDWARHKGQGLTNSVTVAITKEMFDNKEKNMTKKEIIQELTIEELRSGRPDLVEKLSDKTLLTEMASLLGVEESKVLETIKEMKSTNDKLQEQLSFMEVEKEVASRVKVASLRPLIQKLVLSEMKSGMDRKEAVNKVLTSDEGKALLAEMDFKIPKKAYKADERDRKNIIIK